MRRFHFIAGILGPAYQGMEFWDVAIYARRAAGGEPGQEYADRAEMERALPGGRLIWEDPELGEPSAPAERAA